MNSQLATQGQTRLLGQLEQWGLPKQAIATLVGRHTPVRYPKGVLLFRQGAPADVVFAVSSGLVKVYCPWEGGKRVLVELAGPGDVVGYCDFVDRAGERSQLFEAQALTSCCAALFTRQQLAEVLAELPAQGLVRLLGSLNSFWSSLAHRYAMFLSMSLRQRLEAVLRDLAARFGVSEARGVLLTPELAQEELAEMIGSSRPMISKLLAEMAEQGVVARQGRRHILLRGSGLDLAARGPSGLAAEGEEPGAVRRAAAEAGGTAGGPLSRRLGPRHSVIAR